MFSNRLIQQVRVISEELNVPLACLLAVVQVESGGKYLAKINGRDEPLIRFEGHYFYRLLPKAKRNIAIVKGLANMRAGRVRNPYRQAARWAMLNKACAINRPAALASVSWGVGQVMGVHWRWLGYASIDALVLEARNGLEGQIRLMAKYINKAGLVKNLVARDWAGFARAYNGPAYRRYKYHIKLARAYRQFARLHEEPGRTAASQAKRHEMAHLRLGSQGAGVLALQNQLGALGFYLARDGDFGPATQRIVKRFQRQSRLKPDGIVGPKTFEVLMRKMPVHAL